MNTETRTTINSQKISARELHKYVWVLFSIFALLAVTYPTAMLRVSQKEKFQGFHVKSMTMEGKLSTESDE